MQEIPTAHIPPVDTPISYSERFKAVRAKSEKICSHLHSEDYVVQPIIDVSPPKWHLAHSTWFFETFFLKPFCDDYEQFHSHYPFLFNSYYEAEGKRVLRPNRGNLTRPTVKEVYAYRTHVDEAMIDFLENNTLRMECLAVFELGLQHEMQHQELLVTDIKYILGMNPIFPKYQEESEQDKVISSHSNSFVRLPEGIYEIGFTGQGFHFDNECNRHKVYLNEFGINNSLVTYGDYLEFIEDDGYNQPSLWHSDGWSWLKNNSISSPLHMHNIDSQWYRFTLGGLQPINKSEVLMHVSFYEAFAFANWKGKRLPTEYEWEAASHLFEWGSVWEWTNSAYLPYPGFKAAPGALGEYNGKFMVNQMVLRGASVATNPFQVRHTYRNFFQPELQWQFTGIRLAE